MKTIIIKSIHLVNFKGVRDLAIDFDSQVTTIAGRNGTGKTTVFDAFTWLMFGKDSQNREQFDFKTLDADGKIIYQLPHEVSAVISVDGEDMTICRRCSEKWPKRGGKPKFTGNNFERFINDVPYTDNDFTAKIREICDEDTFKKITSPTFFVSQSVPKQKEDLLRMAGELSDADLAAGNPEFETLLAKSAGKTLDEYGREIGAKRKSIKDELESLPGRIDEKKRDISARTDDWSAIESAIAETTAKRDAVDSQLTDIDAAAKTVSDERMKLAHEINNRRMAANDRRRVITETATAEYYERLRERDDIDRQINSAKRDNDADRREIDEITKRIKNLATERETLLAEYNRLKSEGAKIAASTITFNDDDFVCPTCHRPFDTADIAAKQEELTASFEKRRANDAEANAKAIETNVAAGRGLKKRRLDYESAIVALNDKIVARNNKIAELTERRAPLAELAKLDVEPLIAADAELAKINADIDAIQSRIDDMQSTGTNDDNREELKNERAAYDADLDSLKSKLAVREIVANDEKRLAELEKQYRALNDEMTELEHMLYIMEEFSKAKSEAIDARINGLFRMVRFRWIKYLVNGNEKETCEASINGVPYSSLNTAGRIAAGIDIINAICRFEGITAPVFVDNAESINQLPELDAQVIKLAVSLDDHITVHHGL